MEAGPKPGLWAELWCVGALARILNPVRQAQGRQVQDDSIVCGGRAEAALGPCIYVYHRAQSNCLGANNCEAAPGPLPKEGEKDQSIWLRPRLIST